MRSGDQIKNLDTNEDSIVVNWCDGFHSRFHFIWLRDNCRCHQCGDPEIGRRELRLTGIELNVVADHSGLVAGGLAVRWDDGHCSEYKSEWLRLNAYDEPSRRGRFQRPIIWNCEFREHPVELDFSSVISDESEFFRLLMTVHNHGLCFLKEAPLEQDTLETLASKIGPIQESNFGRVQDIVIDNTKKSIANSVEALKPHTDEPYRASPPGVLLFHCIETDIEGAGASVFLDGFEAAETLREEDPDGFESLSSHRQDFRRHFPGEVNLVAGFPVISVDEFGNIAGVRVNDRVMAPVSLPAERMRVYYRGLRRLLQLCEDQSRTIQRVLKPGDIAVFDNHRVLHGRTRLNLNGRRWLQWIQLERGDLYSTMRIQGDRLDKEELAFPGRGAYG